MIWIPCQKFRKGRQSLTYNLFSLLLMPSPAWLCSLRDTSKGLCSPLDPSLYFIFPFAALMSSFACLIHGLCSEKSSHKSKWDKPPRACDDTASGRAHVHSVLPQSQLKCKSATAWQLCRWAGMEARLMYLQRTWADYMKACVQQCRCTLGWNFHPPPDPWDFHCEGKQVYGSLRTTSRFRPDYLLVWWGVAVLLESDNTSHFIYQVGDGEWKVCRFVG